jgi:hypothetical protein
VVCCDSFPSFGSNHRTKQMTHIVQLGLKKYVYKETNRNIKQKHNKKRQHSQTNNHKEGQRSRSRKKGQIYS